MLADKLKGSSKMLDRRATIIVLATGPALLVAGCLEAPVESEAETLTISQPRLTGYEMPLESEPHERTFMQWPASLEVYDKATLKKVQTKIALIANVISEFEPVVMLASPDAARVARGQLSRRVEIWDIPTDDLWCRDSGPTFVKNAKGKLAVAHIQFNGWGQKQKHANDARIAQAVAKRLGLPFLATGLVGEQGGVDHDGAGTLLAHASSWVNPNRNAGSAAAIGGLLTQALGAQKIIWAPGIKGADITDYHIDALARFVSPGRVLIQLPQTLDPNDPWSVAAFETYEILKQSTDSQGRKLDIVVLPEPVNIRANSDDFVASYVNYYVCNGAVISAEFGDTLGDDKGRSVLGALYPGREIISLNIDAIGEAGGGIHCATQQQPVAA
jgi:agmatine deiminase